MTGIFGKLPTHGDFVRRGLPRDFVDPWDAWLQTGLASAQTLMGDAFAQAWTRGLAWRFHLPAGTCGSEAAAGVWISSVDAVGRRYPLTLAACGSCVQDEPSASWYDALEQAGRAARDGGYGVDDLAASLPQDPTPRSVQAGRPRSARWWRTDGHQWHAAELPPPARFAALLLGQQDLARPDAPAASLATHRGAVRSRNEDALLDRGDIGLWVVADGAGGHGAGDVASNAIVESLSSLPSGLSAAELLARVRLNVDMAHESLQRMSAERRDVQPVSTVVILMAGGEHFACLWAGDSRAYLLRQGTLCQLTRDHSVTQELVDAGVLRPEDADGHPQSNVITRAVGGPDALALDKVVGRLQAGDQIVLCSDGLYKELSDARIEALLVEGGNASTLVDACLAHGARDNVTVIVVAF